jgi:hypothetical protein
MGFLASAYSMDEKGDHKPGGGRFQGSACNGFFFFNNGSVPEFRGIRWKSGAVPQL